MTTGYIWRREHAAAALAQLLTHARAHVASTRPRVCCDCGHVFTVPSLTNGRRCMACGVEHAPSQGWIESSAMSTQPNDAPGNDCPDHGPYADDDCPKC